MSNTPSKFGIDRLNRTNLQFPTTFGPREEKLAQAVIKHKGIEDTFDSAVLAGNTDNTDGSAYTGATGEVVALHSRVAAYEVYQAAVAAAAVVAPYQSASGLELAPVAAGDALEITNGVTSLSPAAFTVGSSHAFFFEADITIDDISDVTTLMCGFRKAAAYTADPNDYTDMAAFSIGDTDDGRVSIATILNNAATVLTDTTETDWADAGEHTLRVDVDAAGVCTFSIDGAEPTVTKAFTFDDGDTVIPFIALNTETGDPGVSISSWRVGLK